MKNFLAGLIGFLLFFSLLAGIGYLVNLLPWIDFPNNFFALGVLGSVFVCFFSGLVVGAVFGFWALIYFVSLVGILLGNLK